MWNNFFLSLFVPFVEFLFWNYLIDIDLKDSYKIQLPVGILKKIFSYLSFKVCKEVILVYISLGRSWPQISENVKALRNKNESRFSRFFYLSRAKRTKERKDICSNYQQPKNTK